MWQLVDFMQPDLSSAFCPHDVTFLTRWKTIGVGLADLQSPALHFRMSATVKPERSNHEKFTHWRVWITFPIIFYISFSRSFQFFFVEFIANRFAIVLVFNFYLNFVANTLNLVNTNLFSPAVKANLKRTKQYQQRD